jgi:hypothetical protein
MFKLKAPSSAISPQRHKYFGAEQQQQQASPISPPVHRPPSIPIPITTKTTSTMEEPSPEAGTTAQFEMTRSAELTLFRERHPSAEGAAVGGISARMPEEEEGQRQTVPRREIPVSTISIIL